MRKHFITILTLACALQTAGFCQSKNADDTKPKASKFGDTVIVFKNATIIDGSGASPIKNGYLIVHGNKIESVSAKAPAKIPSGARVIDASGKTIMPTIVLGHAHLGMLEGASSSGANESEALDIKQLKRYAQYGIGAVMSLGADHDFIFGLRDKRNKGLIGGPYILTAGHGIGVPNGAPPPFTGVDAAFRPASIKEALKNVDEMAERHVDILKIWVDDFAGTIPKMKPEMYKAIIAEAHKRGLRVAAHVWYLADAKALIADGVDVLAHSIRDLPVDDELIAAMKSHNVFQIPTLAVDESFFVFKDKPEWMNSKAFKDDLEPGIMQYLKSDHYVPMERERKALPIAEKNLKTLYDAGVQVGFGTDSGGKERPQGFTEHRELQLMVAAGLTPMQAIKCATSNSAKMLGLASTMGTLADGKLANLIVLNADPLTDISNTTKIESVWIDGKEQPKN